LTDITIKNM